MFSYNFLNTIKTLLIKTAFFVSNVNIIVNIMLLMAAAASLDAASPLATAKSYSYFKNNNGQSSFKSSVNNLSASSSSVANVVHRNDSGSIASTLANHYQVITICNSLPSILKCQNRQHFLILHRVVYGLSNTSGFNGAANCVPQTTCLQVDESDQFNCTGSNICVFYPIDRSISSCSNLESNLTQIHITCVSLMHFKRYYTQLNNNKQKIDFQNRTQDANANQSLQFHTNNFYGANLNWFTSSNRAPKTNLNGNTTITITNSPVMVSEFTFLERNSIVVIVMTVVSSLVAVVLFLLAYYKIRMRQLNRTRSPIVTNSSSSESSNVTSIKQTTNDTDKILNVNKKHNNLFKSHPSSLRRLHNNANYRFRDGFNNKVFKLRTFFTNLLQKSSQEEPNINTTKCNNLNDAVFNKQSAKYYSIALNLLQGGTIATPSEHGSIYENSLCTCSVTSNSSDGGGICATCFKKCENKLDYPMMRKTLDHTTNSTTPSIPLDILNSSSLIPSSISLVHANANYVLYDIPEVDETSAETDKDITFTDYYYNHTEKI